jgi:transposase InsO family protein
VDRLAGAKSPHPNRISPEIEEAVLNHSLEFPTHGPVRVGHELQLRGITVGSSAVRGVWSRHSLLTKHERLLRLEKAQQEKSFELNPEQVKLLERFSPEFRERHIEAPHTGALVAVDTFMVGALKGVGRVYLQTVIDCHSRFAFGRLYTSKMPVTAVHVLNTDVLPFFESHDAKVDAILSDNGREFCGRPDQHPYELFLQLEGIEHKTTRVRRPQSNGIAERMHKTLLDEHFRIEGRKTWYESVEQMQGDLENYLQGYNYKRPHQGRNMAGRTPYEVFVEGILMTVKEQEETTDNAA